jgi:hypothetical protein
MTPNPSGSKACPFQGAVQLSCGKGNVWKPLNGRVSDKNEDKSFGSINLGKVIKEALPFTIKSLYKLSLSL